jgi:hypothetical protein
MPRRVIALILLLFVLGGAAMVIIDRTMSFGDTDLGLHGTIALALGIGLTLLLGVGLMALVFYSARKGFDARAADKDVLK